MHMKIGHDGDTWTCAEASLTTSLGYGTYKVTVRDASNLHESAVFAMFTWDYARPDQSNGEMDMEYNYWQEKKENFQYGSGHVRIQVRSVLESFQEGSG